METNILIDNSDGTISISNRGSDSKYTFQIINGAKTISLNINEDELAEMIKELDFILEDI